MGLSLASGVHFVIADERCIFLDLRRDRYFSLPPKLESKLMNQLNGMCALSEEDERILARLGLFTQSDGILALPPTVAALADKSFTNYGSPRAAMIISALCHQVSAGVLVKFLPLSRVLAGIASAKERRGSATQDERVISNLVTAFHSSAAFMTSHNRCLMKSLALMRAFLSHGQEAQMVIGVQARPFAAHCWLQRENQVLTDSADHIATYTPIFAV